MNDLLKEQKGKGKKGTSTIDQAQVAEALLLAGYLDDYNNGIYCPAEAPALRVADGSPTIEEELVGELKFNAYPIPYEDVVSFDFVSPVDTRATLEIVSMTGAILEKVYDGDIRANERKHVEINLNKYANALYLYRFSTNNGQKLGKLIPRR